MKKKKSGGGGANWMDTYGDMVTLLLCFFVLLYSMSTISQEKWEAIVTSFNPFAILDPTDPEGNGGPIADPNLGQSGVNEPDSTELVQEQIDEQIEDFYLAMVAYAQANNLENAVAIEKAEDGRVYIRLNQNVMFNGDSASLRQEGEDILVAVAGMLDNASDAIEEVRIEGHTARYVYNRPNPEYKDWELSSTRALNVQYFLFQNCENIHPSRLVTESFGQWRPDGDNKDEAGRAVNRRVVLIVSGRNIEEELKGNSIEQIYIDKLG